MKGGGHFTAGDGVDIFYTQEGPRDGIPILLLHGWVCDQNDWSFQIPLLLSLGFWIISMDLRGHGRSSIADNITAFDPVTLANDAAALLAHHGIHGDNDRRAIVMGHSLGAVVAHELVFRHTHLVSGTVEVDTAYYMTPPVMSDVVQLLEVADSGQAGVAATDFFAAAGVYPADRTPAWLPIWHQRRAWAMQSRVVTSTFQQMAQYLGESGVAYLNRTRPAGGRNEIPRFR
ncbi:Alpha/Beta hydrolase protein [Emericellopsis atlantica]|uniref:Alpha/Beta hydrolase protein n=1 Tax=Emericellopsis atlantica TaxID=2614577 RepID=A0A9P8CPM5_9HYPO|nr:Alpha/Beta hydrolase protein [Emericellopsis atlantica]KAG9254352.1 Alpha/Beta hydrolase protein [Emericellopsis atlantica]